MEKKFLNPPGVAASPAYTHVVAVSGGRTVFVSARSRSTSTAISWGREIFARRPNKPSKT